MAVFNLPTDIENARYVFQTNLDGVAFRLSFKFNSREETWYMTVLDPNGVQLRSGLKVVNDFPLFRLWQLLDRPEGEILAINGAQLTEPPNFEQLGTDSVLVYVDGDDVG